ncbi:MAG: hypothetical protein WB787_08785 [Candidatus Acidiferrales bacterium]
MTRSLKFTLILMLFCATPAFSQSQEASLTDALKSGRSAISVKDYTLVGPGADVLRAATADAQFVLLGEDHGIAQIPQFAGALCAELAPRGFHNMAIETGPILTPEIERFARDPDGLSKLADFEKRYPAGIAFYNWREEFSLLQQCEKSGAPAAMHLWGLDQELMGAPSYVLDLLVRGATTPETRAAAERLLEENRQDYAVSAKSGDPSELFLMKAPQAELDQFLALLKNQSGPMAHHNISLMESLLKSRDIYQKFMSASGYASNRERAELMKSNFVRDYSEAERRDGVAPRVFFKFGGNHMYRGLNPLHSSELGNYVAELAEGRGQKSVHIFILGVKGKELQFAGIGKPSGEAPVDLAGDPDSGFKYFKPLFDNMLADSWTLYDLRVLRDHFGKYGKVDPELERTIFGYEFVVLIPDPTPSHDLAAPGRN